MFIAILFVYFSFLVGLPEEFSDDEDDDFETRQLKNTYLQTCEMLGVIPASSFKRQMSTRAICMKSHPSGPDGARAMAIALVVSNGTISVSGS